MKAQMHLAIDVSWTQVETTWREPGARVGRHYPDIGLFEDIRARGGARTDRPDLLW